MSALPSFLVAIAPMFMLESPRFILCKGREHKTIRDRDLYFTTLAKTGLEKIEVLAEYPWKKKILTKIE